MEQAELDARRRAQPVRYFFMGILHLLGYIGVFLLCIPLAFVAVILIGTYFFAPLIVFLFSNGHTSIFG